MPDNINSCAKVVTAMLRDNVLFYAVGLLAALGLKYYYSNAGADDLGWILTPVARLAGLLGGIHFQWEPHAGFVSHSSEVIIAPACAGINFLIICFSTIFFTFTVRLSGTAAKCAWFGVSVATAYLVTVCANTIRIIISIYLYSAPIYGGWVTPERVHRLTGTLIYVSILVATFLAVERFMQRCNRLGPHEPMTVKCGAGSFPSAIRFLPVPFVWYALVTIILPLLNGAVYRSGSRFAEHSALVIAAGLCIFAIPFSAAAILKKRVDILNKTKEKRENA